MKRRGTPTYAALAAASMLMAGCGNAVSTATPAGGGTEPSGGCYVYRATDTCPPTTSSPTASVPTATTDPSPGDTSTPTGEPLEKLRRVGRAWVIDIDTEEGQYLLNGGVGWGESDVARGSAGPLIPVRPNLLFVYTTRDWGQVHVEVVPRRAPRGSHVVSRTRMTITRPMFLETLFGMTEPVKVFAPTHRGRHLVELVRRVPRSATAPERDVIYISPVG